MRLLGSLLSVTSRYANEPAEEGKLNTHWVSLGASGRPTESQARQQ